MILRQESASLRVAAPATAFVDLLTDLKHAPPLADLARLAVQLPLSGAAVLREAAARSDTVLKRAAWLLGWSGRVTHARLPFADFTPSPALLDPRIDDRRSLTWDRRFRLFVPPEGFGWRPMLPLTRRTRAWTVWLRLRSAPLLRRAQREQGQLLTRGDPQLPRIVAGLRILARLPRPERLVRWARYVGFYPQPSDLDTRSLSTLADFFSKILPDRSLRRWLRRTARPEYVNRLSARGIDALLTLAAILRQDALTVTLLRARGESVADRSDCHGAALAAHTWCQQPALPADCPDLLLLLLRAGLAHDRPAWMHRLMAALPKSAFDAPTDPWALLVHGFAANQGKPWSARQALVQALWRWRHSANHHAMALAASGLGQLNLGSGNTALASRYFRRAWSSFQRTSHRDVGWRGVFRGQLGIARFRVGHHDQAAALLERAVRDTRRGGRPAATAAFLSAWAGLLLVQGAPERALPLLRESHQLRQPLRSADLLDETASLLSWCHALLGYRWLARHWVNRMASATVRDQARLQFARTREAIMRGDFAAADSAATEARTLAAKADLNPIERARIVAVATLVQHALRPTTPRERLPELAVLAEPRVMQAEVAWFALVFALFGHPDHGPDEVRRTLELLRLQRTFDPFWFLLALPLAAMGGEAATLYLLEQDRRSPAHVRELGRKWLRRSHATDLLALLASQPGSGRIGAIGPNGALLVEPQNLAAILADTTETDFIIDLAAGRLSFAATSVDLRIDAIPSRLLDVLVQSWPHPVPIDEAFEVVWGTTYDEEIDLAIVKSALNRIRRQLTAVCPRAGVTLHPASHRGHRRAAMLELILPERWQAWVRVGV